MDVLCLFKKGAYVWPHTDLILLSVQFSEIEIIMDQVNAVIVLYMTVSYSLSLWDIK